MVMLYKYCYSSKYVIRSLYLISYCLEKYGSQARNTIFKLDGNSLYFYLSTLDFITDRSQLNVL